MDEQVILQRYAWRKLTNVSTRRASQKAFATKTSAKKVSVPAIGENVSPGQLKVAMAKESGGENRLNKLFG